MFIHDDTLIHNDRDFRISMSFAAAKNKLRDCVCQITEENEGKSGFIKIKDIEFYGARGTCMMFFPKGELYQIEIMCEWHSYEMCDKAEKETQMMEAIQKIISRCENNMTEAFEHPISSKKYHKLKYVSGSLSIRTAEGRDDDSYDIWIR